MTNLTFIDQCSSTNDEVIKYFPENQPDFFGLYTLNQTNGRGQYGNSWDILPGENIALSIMVKNQPYLSNILINFYTAIILREFVANMTEVETKIKWPNDVILKGKKISGILIEKRKIKNENYYIVGIGINLLQQQFTGVSKAGSIYTQSGLQLNPERFTEDFLKKFTENIALCANESKIMEAINNFLFKKEEIGVFKIKNISQNGIIQNVDCDGYLWVNLENDGLQRFFHKEIEMLY